MMIETQYQFCQKMKTSFPEYFKGKRVLVAESLSQVMELFEDCNYLQIKGNLAEYDAPTEQFDVIVSDSAIENSTRMLKTGGAIIFTGDFTKFDEYWYGFALAFPDGVNEDLNFFGVKGGIANAKKYSPSTEPSIIRPNEYDNDIFVIDTWPDTPEKEQDLVDCLKRLRVYKGIDILLVSHYPIKPEIQKLADYYLFDKENPLLLNSEFESHGVSSGRWTKIKDYRVDNSMKYHHDFAIWRSMTLAFNFCKMLGKETIHFMEYDCIVDQFQYRQSFLEKSQLHDAVVYEYNENSSIDSHFSSYIATYIFSIKTDIAVAVMDKIKSKREYFTNKPNGWQLERVFWSCLKETTSSIGVTPYIPNSNELNTQAVWNRDGIYRDDALFQIYPAADDNGDLFVHLISGFHETKATKDYLIEVRYGNFVKFVTLIKDSYELVNVGKYEKGKTLKVNYLGKTVYSEFLQDDHAEFIKLNYLSYTESNIIPEVSYNFVDGAYLELVSESSQPYLVNFIDQSTDTNIFSTELRSKYWSKTDEKFFRDWKIQVSDTFGNIIHEIKFDATGQRVYIGLDSRALGDTLAWFPYVEEFRKKHNCEVICSTFWNQLFEETYPNIKFIEPGQGIPNLYAAYQIGYHYDGDNYNTKMVPRDFKLSPLQRTAADILGLDYVEIKPIIKHEPKPKTNKVGLAIHGTAQAKYWNNPEGWQDITNWLIINGYEPVILSREEDGYMGNSHPTGAKKLPAGPIETVIDTLSECQAVIGISSGLTWLSWAVGTPTIQVSGFTEPYNEPDNGMVKLAAPFGACSGCANRLKLDAGDWNWCPEHKGTDRQFECSKLITSERVITELKKILI